nr:hypothetical protein [Tanacetum cinerariifolium]
CNPVFILKASIPSKRKLDLTTGINFLGYGLLNDHTKGRGLQLSQDIEYSHMTLIPVHPDGQQESSSVLSFVTSMLNSISDVGVESIFTTALSSVAPLPTPIPTMTPSIITTITTASHPPIPLTPIPTSFSEYRQTNPFAEAVSNIPVAADLSKMKLKKILIEIMEGNKSIQRSNEQRNLYKALVDAYEADILDSYGETSILKRRREDDDDQEGPSSGSDRGSKRRREGGEPESARAPLKPTTRSTGRSITGSKSRQVSASESAFAEESVQTISQIEEPSHLKPPTPDHDWNTTLPAVQGSAHTWISELAKQADSRSSFNELLDTLIDFSNFIMNRLGIDTLTHKLLAIPTYELIRGSCNSLTELEYHLEEVYKATMDQLDWVNPEGQQYPHNLLLPLSLITDNRGRRVIPFSHFIINDFEYLRGGASSRKYTTSVTKTNAADFGHIKWIEDLVPRTMWIQEPINYDKYALWGVSHWGWKRQQFYKFAINWESALDISVRRDDDKIYKFKEGDFKRLRLQDIEDMLLLLVQGKLSNLTVEERFAFNVSIRMFTRSIVIQRCVKDLQLGVESYQKRLNLTKPDTYRSDLKRRKAYTAYSNPIGFLYQNKDKKNRLMRIDEFHKFSDGTLNDVRNALDDRLKGIRMQYL